MLDWFTDISSLLNTQPGILITLMVVTGLLCGSFLNVVIHRLPIMMQRQWEQSCMELRGEDAPVPETFNLAVPRSACPACGHKISALENIPILSYLFLRGKCSACGTPISLRYPLVEALTGSLLGLAAWHFGATPLLFGAVMLTLALIVLTFIDLDTQLLPDDITLPLLWLGLLLNIGHTFTDLQSAVIGAMAGYLLLWSIYWLFKLITGKEGMGYGDFKLLAALGAWFGWQLLPAVLLLASVSGSVIGISMIAFAKHGRQVPIPFGPYLALGGLSALYLGKQLFQLYGGA